MAYDENDLLNEAFIAYVKKIENLSGLDAIKPDDRDFKVVAKTKRDPTTDEERAKFYRLAQGHRLMRLFEEWKASQN